MNHQRHNMFNKCLMSIASYQNNYILLPNSTFWLKMKERKVALDWCLKSRLWLLGHEPQRSPTHYKLLSSIWWSSEDLPRMSLTRDLNFLEAYSCYFLNQFLFSYLSFSFSSAFLTFKTLSYVWKVGGDPMLKNISEPNKGKARLGSYSAS